ncbi:MAG TPA: CBS domain-containing protein [Candidatus Acidoferrales bacterium]|nr:CBS domain-containing protein [Candidatus Acidoferrales bacterium]
MLVKDIYNKHLIPISEDITIKEALALMIKSHFNGVVVLNHKEELVGILCIQDIVASIVPIEMQENVNLAEAMYKEHFFQDMCAKVKNKKVKDIMRKEFFKVTLAMSVMAVAAEFLNTDLFVFPVMEENKVIGIVTRSELKKALALGMEITP